MLSLILGVVAALSWGLHDFMVRNVSQQAAVAPLVFVTLSTGSLALAPLTVIAGDWSAMNPQAMGYAVVAGVCYAFGSVGLFRAFAIGPVRLVAPIVGAFPMLSVAMAMVQGQSISALQWGAVAVVVGGIALVARSGDATEADPQRSAAIGWAVMAAVGFALTFGFGQTAARIGSELPATLITRLAALAVICTSLIATRARIWAVRPWLSILILMGCLDVIALTSVLVAGSFANPEYAAVASSVFGIVTILLSWRFLNEAMRPLQWFGVLVVFAGIGTLAAL